MTCDWKPHLTYVHAYKYTCSEFSGSQFSEECIITASVAQYRLLSADNQVGAINKRAVTYRDPAPPAGSCYLIIQSNHYQRQ